MNKSRHISHGLLLKGLTASILAITLGGCLGGGGGSKSSPPAANDPLAVSTSEGDVRGISLNSMRVFRAIPYAQAPIGDLRFAPTAPALERNATLQLSETFGSPCPQRNLSSGQLEGAEDCLFLNVYTPAGVEAGDDLPVMVWIHGGAFVFGNGGGEYDPARLVAEDVIVVTLNYRLGNLGFLAHPELGNGDGNFGLMDQQEALRWVKRNIENFGGNPDNVTLFGESAGGHSVMSHIVSPSAISGDLFQRAIVQSGSYAPDQMPLAVGQSIGSQIEATARTLFADTCTPETLAADCFRSLSVAQILALQGSQSVPTSGGSFLPRSIRLGLTTGNIVPNLEVMIGSNLNEGTLFVALDELNDGPLELRDDPQAVYEAEVSELLQTNPLLAPQTQEIADFYRNAYAEAAPGPLSQALSAIWTDYMFACNSIQQASQFGANDVPVYKYWFTDTNAPWTLVPPFLTSFPQGATHAGEIPYVLYPQALMRSRYAGDVADVDALAAEMVDYWTTFAKNGSPNASGNAGATWPEFAGSGELQELTVPASTPELASAFSTFHRCGQWATWYANGMNP